MQQSYKKNYLKIYFFQILSIVLGFASMFVVIPYLSSDPTTYGIYAICISVTIFLSYADLGFLGAAQKFAAESLVQGDRDKEMSLIGFSHFILLVFVLLLSGLFLLFSFNPHWLIKGIEQGAQYDVAQKLLLILAVFAPTMVVQRALQLIFGIRLQEYQLQKINIVGSIIKILSVFYFFTGGRYDIVGYFLFLQLVSVGVAVGGLLLARKNYGYEFLKVLRKLRFDRSIFVQTRGLAFASLFATLSWVAYYEFDSIAIGKLMGAEAVAIYAIGLSMLGFVRSILGVFFSPFSARFNHFMGAGEEQAFKHFYRHVMFVLFPVVVFPLLGAAMMAQGIVISWVGESYRSSVVVVQWLMLCNILGFVSYPAGMMLVAQKQIQKMNIITILMPLIFWGGVLTTIGYWGVLSFAVFKFVAFALTGLVYIYFSLKFLEISLLDFLRRNILPYVPAILVLIALFWALDGVCINGKNKLNLLINCLFVFGGILVGIGVSLLTNKPLRNYAKELLRTIRPR